MNDNMIEYRTVSQCVSPDWCRGFNDAAKEANETIARQKAEIERLEKGELSKAMTFNSNTIKRCVNEAIKEFAEKAKESASHGWNKSIDEIAEQLFYETGETELEQDDKYIDIKNATGEIDLLKNLVRAAIFHGGDGGGPYFSAGEKLKKHMEAYLKHRGLDKEYQVSGELDNWLTFEKSEKELTVDLASQISKCESIANEKKTEFNALVNRDVR